MCEEACGEDLLVHVLFFDQKAVVVAVLDATSLAVVATSGMFKAIRTCGEFRAPTILSVALQDATTVHVARTCDVT